jgi:hypothetical protein
MDNYSILELPADAPIEDVKRAYKRLALKYHPDKNPSTEAADQFKRISEAYQNIIDPPQQQQQQQQEVNPHDIFQHFFSQMHQSQGPQVHFMHQGFGPHGFPPGMPGFPFMPGMPQGFPQGVQFIHIVQPTQHSVTIQDGKKIERIVENGQVKTIITDLQTNQVIQIN